jgi:uncharacterized membrane protein YeiB
MPQFIYREVQSFLTGYSIFFTTVLLGFWAARSGYVHRIAERKPFLRFFHWLTFVGRMPLTNCLTQSLICTLLFYGYGFGAVDSLTPAAAFALSFAIWGFQIPLSVLWFRHFRFGPMEWLWRAATYGAVRTPRPQAVVAPAIE